MIDRVNFRKSQRLLLALVLVLAMGNWLSASPAVIGVAVANGGFRVNDASVTGNATLFDGAVVETSKASSSIRLGSGVVVNLGASSRARIFEDRVVMERGQGEFAGNYRLEAAGLRVEPSTASASARFSLKRDQVFELAAVKGSYRVLNSTGFVVASLEPGRALEFDPQAGASAPSTLTGCVTKSDGKYYLSDEISGAKVELIGSKLESEKGSRVEVVGSAMGNQQIQVNTLKRLGRGCSVGAAGAGAASGAKAGGAAGKAAGVGMASSTKAIIAGVAVAAAGGTAAGVYSATRDDAPPSSR